MKLSIKGLTNGAMSPTQIYNYTYKINDFDYEKLYKKFIETFKEVFNEEIIKWEIVKIEYLIKKLDTLPLTYEYTFKYYIIRRYQKLLNFLNYRLDMCYKFLKNKDNIIEPKGILKDKYIKYEKNRKNT